MFKDAADGREANELLGLLRQRMRSFTIGSRRQKLELSLTCIGANCSPIEE